MAPMQIPPIVRPLAVWLILACVPATVLAQGPQAPARQPSETTARQAPELLTITGDYLGTLQWIARGDRRQEIFPSTSLDLNVSLKPTRWLELFLDVEGLVGQGPDQRLGTLSRLSNDADRLFSKEKAIVVRELLLRISWLDDRARFSFGQIDPGELYDRNLFAQDETAQFMSTAFVNNPMIKFPANGPAAALYLEHGERWYSTVGVHAPGDVQDNLAGVPFIIGEVGRRNLFALEGTYRLWGRVASVFEDRDRLTWGLGVSLDQYVTRHLGVFARAGISRNQGDAFTAHAWSAGVQVTPTWLGRKDDRAAIAYSFLTDTPGRERFVEAYYSLGLTEWFSLIGNVQWVIEGPNTVTGGINRDAVIPGLRALVSF
jgi:hypothetical protein